MVRTLTCIVVSGVVTTQKKKGKRKKNPAGPHLSAALPFLCFAPRDANARVVAAGVHSRDTCRPSSCAVPNRPSSHALIRARPTPFPRKP